MHRLQGTSRQAGYMRTAAAVRCRPLAPVKSLTKVVETAAVEDAIQTLFETATQVEPLFAACGRVELSKVAPQIEQLAQVASSAGVSRVDPALNEGVFEGKLTTDMRQIELDATTSLGRMSFNKFLPTDLKVQMNDNIGKALTQLPDQRKGPFEDIEKGYVVYSHFKILASDESSSSSGDCVHGVMTVIGKYEIAGEEHPNRLNISFDKIRLQPANPAEQLQSWIDALGPHNPSMNKETGHMEVVLEAPPKGSLDYLVMTDEWHISKGNFGTVVAMHRK